MTSYNGGYIVYPDKVDTREFYRNTCSKTKDVTIASGQVLKRHTWLQSGSDGKHYAYVGSAEKATVTFPTKVDTGETVIIAGLTFTAGSNSTTTKAQLVAAWAGLPVGTTYTQANALNSSKVSSAIGTFTAGTLTGYNTQTSATDGSVDFVSTSQNTNVTDLTVTGTGDASTVTIVPTTFPSNKIAGLLLFDVDASGGDTLATAYTEVSLYADAIVWAVDVATDTITLFDGTTKAVTAYNTGCAGTTDAAKLLQRKFVEQSEFEPLGYRHAGEIM